MKSNILISLLVFAILIITVYSSQSHCRHPKIPSYGYIKKGRQNKYRIGNVVHFACQRGYKLAGRSSIKCLKHGNWNRKSPICKIAIITVCGKLRNPQYGEVKITGIKIGSKALYTCNAGFVLRGNKVRHCQRNGHWSGSTPSCKRVIIRCSRLNDPRNGDVKLTGTNVGDKAIYKCDRGFILKGNNVRKCQTNGKWSGNKPVCKGQPRRCNRLDDPRNGNVRLTGTNIGDKAIYQCDRRFVLKGDRLRKCQSNGQWSGNEPICKTLIIDCGNLRDPRNGDVKLTGTRVGAKAIYKCNRGFILKGSNVRKCQTNGRWSGKEPVCIGRPRRCNRLDDPRNGDVRLTGTKVGDKAIYQCDRGFVLKGDRIRKCQSNGQWSGNEPICKALIIDCGNLRDPRNGDVDITGTTVGSRATYSCDNDFILQGNIIRKCQNSGEWSGKEPICIRVDCGVLNAPLYGQISLTGTSVGSQALYKCDKGFVLIGNDLRTCKKNGEWSGVAPKCQPVDCGDLEDPKYGQVDVSTTIFGSIAMYSCDKGFQLIGNNARQCLINGEWSNEAPVCQKIIIDCGNLSPPKYGEVYHSGTGFGAIAHYSCYFGYKLVGDRQRQCTIYGDWSGHTPVCIYIKFQH